MEHPKMLKNERGFYLIWVISLSIIILLLSTTYYSSSPFTTISKRHLNKITPMPQNKSTNGGSIEHECDFSAGKWVREVRVSAYSNVTCPTLPDLNNCVKYGKDDNHLHWRWKPDRCELPRFEPTEFLSIVRGKKMAFVGDSIAKSQMDSLLCLLSQAETPIEIQKDANDKPRTWHFPFHDFTLMVMRANFLLAATPRSVNGTTSSSFDIHLDEIDKDWGEELPDLHYVIISSGNWFFRRNYFYDGGKLIGCTSCMGEPNLTDLDIRFVIRRAFRTILQFIRQCQGCEGLVTMVRTFTSSHFEHGNWNNGGSCNRSQPLDGIDAGFGGGNALEIRRIQMEEVEGMRGGGRRYGVLDVSKAMLMRADGHPGSHWKWNMGGGSDCLHWCLPGAIDVWNDLLFAIMMKDSFL